MSQTSVARKCSFCGRDMPVGGGVMLVKNEGAVFYYCSSKCRKSGVKLRRDPRKLKWTAFYRGGGKPTRG